MHNVVHQDDRSVEGLDGADLAGDGGVVGEGLHGALAQIGGKHLVGVDCFGHRIGHDLAPEHFSIGYAHIFPQFPGGGGDRGHLVVGGDHLQQPLVDDVGGQGEHQKAGVQLGQSHLQPSVAPLDGGEHLGVTVEGVLNGGLQVLDEHRGGAHVHLPDGGVPLPAQEALAGQGVLQHRVRHGAAGAVDAVDAVVSESLGQYLGKEELEIVLEGIGGVGHGGGDDEGGARRAQADAVGQLRIPQGPKELRGGEIPEAEEAQQLVLGAGAQQKQPVPAPENPLPQGVPVGAAGGELLDHQLVGLVHPLEGQVARPQHRLVLAVPQVQAVLVDKVLDHRVDEIGDIPVQVHVFPNAGGADVLQVGGQLELDHVALEIELLGAGQGGLARPAEDDEIHGVDGPGTRGFLEGGGVAHHVAAHHQINLLAGEELP